MREKGFLNHAVVFSVAISIRFRFVVVRVCRIQGLIRWLQIFWFYAIFRPLDYKFAYEYKTYVMFLVCYMTYEKGSFQRSSQAKADSFSGSLRGHLMRLMSSMVFSLDSGMSLNDGIPPWMQNILLSTTAANGRASNVAFTSSQISSPNSSPNLFLHSL